MAIEQVREYFKEFQRDQDILEFSMSSATVELAALALQIEGKRIAKTLSFHGKENAVLVVCAGDARIDNHKFKTTFDRKAKMLKPEEVKRYTNHEIGGVCPFAIPETTKVYLDVSLRRFDHVYPACGSSNSALCCTLEQLETYAKTTAWVDVCKGWQEDE